jgi:hypothetical protein
MDSISETQDSKGGLKTTAGMDSTSLENHYGKNTLCRYKDYR